MILDTKGLYSEDQAITASADSTNSIDHGPNTNPGPGNPVRLVGRVTEAFDALTSLQIALETDDNSAFTSGALVAQRTYLLAELTIGKVLDMGILPGSNMERYTQLAYTVNGTAPTVGKITLGLLSDHDTWSEASFAS